MIADVWWRASWIGGLAACLSLSACSQREPPRAPELEVGSELAQCGEKDRLCVLFRNQMSEAFELVWLSVALDGKRVFNSSRNLSIPERVVFSGAMAPGNHALQLQVRMVGRNERIGNYHFETKSSHNFDVAAAGSTPDRLIAVAYEKSTPAALLALSGQTETPLEERPAVRFIEHPSSSSATSDKPTTRIWVGRTGEIELNGQPVDLDAVEKAIQEFTHQGTIFYAVESFAGELHANGVKVMEMLARKHLSVRMSTRRDFSDMLGAANAGLP
jgi:hypothetical protein